MEDQIDLDTIAALIALMREQGAVYVKAGSIEVTLGPERVKFESPKEAMFVHDGPADPNAPRDRKNPLLQHPSLRR